MARAVARLIRAAAPTPTTGNRRPGPRRPPRPRRIRLRGPRSGSHLAIATPPGARTVEPVRPVPVGLHAFRARRTVPWWGVVSDRVSTGGRCGPRRVGRGARWHPQCVLRGCAWLRRGAWIPRRAWPPRRAWVATDHGGCTRSVFHDAASARRTGASPDRRALPRAQPARVGLGRLWRSRPAARSPLLSHARPGVGLTPRAAIRRMRRPGRSERGLAIGVCPARAARSVSNGRTASRRNPPRVRSRQAVCWIRKGTLPCECCNLD